MTLSKNIRFPDDTAEDGEAVAKIQGISFNSFVVLAVEEVVRQVKGDPEFRAAAKAHAEAERAVIKRLVGQ